MNQRMKFRKIFVTVGTTQFDELISKIASEEILKILKADLGCEQLTVQIGKGKEFHFSQEKDITVEIFTLKNSIAEEIESADLVISHAGAGSFMDVLSRGKNLLVVINDLLMDNHQTELAEQLASDQYLFHTTVEGLPDALRNFDVSKLKPYEKGNVDDFVKFLDNAMGFES